MNSLLRLSLALSALTLLFATLGCHKTEETPAPVTSSSSGNDTMSQGSGMASGQGINPQAREQMTKSLNDPNTPADVKDKIRQQLGIR